MSVKRSNRSAALSILHEKGAMSRKRLAENMNLTPAAITKIVGELIADGLLSEGETVSSGNAGRREILVDLKPDAACGLGVLINIRCAVISCVRLDGQVLFAESFRIEERADAEALTEMLSKALLERMEAANIDRDRVIGLGIAVRGICSPDGRTVVNSFGALRQENDPLRDRFEAATGFRTVMSNNVRALFAAQMFLDREERGGSQFFLRCEYGIGASLSINGEIWRGVTEQCAEIGHIPVVRRGGRLCSCGKSGCLETIASPAAILRDAKELLSPEKTPLLWQQRDSLSLTDVFEAARRGDAGAAEITDRAVSALAQALKAVIYLVDPGRIILYGRMFEEDYYLSRLFAEMREGVDSGHQVKVEKSRYNEALEERAAGLLAVEEYFKMGGIYE